MGVAQRQEKAEPHHQHVIRHVANECRVSQPAQAAYIQQIMRAWSRPRHARSCADPYSAGAIHRFLSTTPSPPPVILDTVAAAEEDHDLLVQVLLEEGEQQQQALVCRHHHVALLQSLARRHGTAVVNTHVQRLVLEAEPRQVLDL